LGKRWLSAHLDRCAACRRELAELREVIELVRTAPPSDPGPEFWSEFSREMHRKLVDASQETAPDPAPARPWWLRLPYVVAGPALAVLLVWVAVQVSGPMAPVAPVAPMAKLKPEAATRMAPAPGPPTRHLAKGSSLEAPKLAAVPRKSSGTRGPALGELAAAPAMETFVPASLQIGTPPAMDDVDISGWDLDSELAGMTDKEKEIFLRKLHQRQKGGSCIQEYFSSAWG
jgi:hypothetical protein